jgi:hypothetical protein
MSGMRLATTGDLRQFLAETMVSVREGKIDLQRADRIAKLAGAVSASMLAETQVALAKLHQGGIGSLRLDGGQDAPVIEAKAEPPRVEHRPRVPSTEEHVFCEQCDRRVTVGEAVACKSQFCKAKAAA